MLALVIPYSENPMERFDTVFSVGVIPVDKYPLFRTLWGLLAGGIPHLKLLALVIPYSGNPNGTFNKLINHLELMGYHQNCLRKLLSKLVHHLQNF